MKSFGWVYTFCGVSCSIYSIYILNGVLFSFITFIINIVHSIIDKFNQ